MTCRIGAELSNGKIERIHPTEKFPCVKCGRLQETVYHPDRLKYPLKNMGRKGEGKWQRISWDEALDTIADRFTELKENYVNGLLDPVRLSKRILEDLRADLGQYGYAGQIGQKPTPPGGGMFKVDNLIVMHACPNNIKGIVRYWDKAGTEGGGARTAGVKIARLGNGKFLVMDVKKGQWASENRERIIKSTIQADGRDVLQYIEQEPGSGGKESAEATIRNNAGYSIRADKPTGDKIHRADPFSVQVNSGNVWMLAGEWNREFMEELEYFPFSTYKDQVDAASGAFTKLTSRKQAGVW
jgi:predicted phage terminase large subunit-like protein